MKKLAKLEKNKIFWYLLSLSVLFFFLRLPSLIEPNWYGDEGIYQVIGIAIAKGQLLYSQIWDNKPPLLYLIYALVNGDQFLVRLFSLKIGLATIGAFFYLSFIMFKHLKAAIVSTIFFILLFATPLLEGNIANAENFILLPVLLAGILIYKYSQNAKYRILDNRYLTLALPGFFLGLAFLLKIVALFDLSAFSIYLFIVSYSSTSLPHSRLASPNSLYLKIKPVLKELIVFFRNDLLLLLIGFVIPIAAASLYFLSQNAFSDFIQATFFSNIGYVGYGNKFIIPQGLLIIKLIFLAAFSILIFWKRKKLTPPVIFTLVWLAFSFFSTYFSNRPYTHYALLAIPSICLLLSLIYSAGKSKQKYTFLIILVLSLVVINSTFKPNFKKSINYYGNAFSFLTGKKSVHSYQSFFDHKAPRDYEIASFLRAHTSDSDSVFVWGDSAQIYALSNKIPPGKYTVSYHIRQYKSGYDETQAAINKSKPKFIVTLPESKSIPFNLPSYSIRFTIKDAVIYERTF